MKPLKIASITVGAGCLICLIATLGALGGLFLFGFFIGSSELSEEQEQPVSAARTSPPNPSTFQASTESQLDQYDQKMRFDTDSDMVMAAYLKAGAEKGYMGNQSLLRNYYVEGRGVPQNYQKAIFWYRKAAAQGDNQATVNLYHLQSQLQSIHSQ